MLCSTQPETGVFVNDGLDFVKYLLAGIEELTKATIRALHNHGVVLREEHGCLAIGIIPGEAFDLIEIPDKSASI